MPEPTDFRTDAEVFSSDGHRLGTLKGVVLRRKDLEVTRVIVDIGFLRSGHRLWEGGLGLDYDRVVPIEAVSRASEKRVDLGWTAARFKDAPEYTHSSYESPPELIAADPGLPNQALRFAERLSGGALEWVVEKQNRARDETDVEEKTPVWRTEPHAKIGEVDHILVDESTGRATAIVIRRGALLRRDVILPVRYLTEILDDVIHVDISDDELDRLRPFDMV